MRRWKTLLFLLCLCLMVAGCGQKQEESTETEAFNTESEADAYEKKYREMEVNALFSGEWKREEVGDSENALRFSDYIPNPFPRLQGDYYSRGYCSDSRNIYSLETYYEKQEDGTVVCTHYLRVLDSVTREVENIVYNTDLFLSQPFLVGGRVFAVKQSNGSSGTMTEYCVVELKEDGTFTTMPDVCGIMEENAMLPEPYFVAESQLYYEPYNQRFYVISPGQDQLFIADREGKQVARLGEDSRCKFQLLTSTEEGRLLFVSTESGKSEVFAFDGDRQISLYRGKIGEESAADCISVDGHGRLIYGYDGISVIEWDTVSGKQQRLYLDGTADQLHKTGFQAVMRNENGEILFLKDNNLSILTFGGASKEVKLAVQPMMFMNTFDQELFRKYAKTHPGVQFEILENPSWEERANTLNRVLAEISQGAGPDLLILSREEMESLNQNNCLADLSGVLNEKTRAQLWDGVEGYGRTENGLMLLPLNAYAQTIYIHKKYLENHPWTVEGILDIMEEQEANGTPFRNLVCGLYDPFLLFTKYITDSEFVDMENGTCSFDSELFVRCLEVCKRYQNEENYLDEGESLARLRDGQALLFSSAGVGFFNLRTYSEICTALEDNYVAVGYPTRSGNGNRMEFSYGFVVNKNAKDREAINDFLNWCYSAEQTEQIYKVPLRKDIFENRLIFDDYSQKPAIRTEPRAIMSFDGQPDGETCIQNYLTFLDSCVYQTGADGADDIRNMVWEEADAFFQGGKSAGQVAKIIQSRVSLYLMENR